MFTSKLFSSILAYLCSQSIGFSLHQKRSMPKRRLRPGLHFGPRYVANDVSRPFRAFVFSAPLAPRFIELSLNFFLLIIHLHG